MGLLHIVEATIASADISSSVEFCQQAFHLHVLGEDGSQVLLGVRGSRTGRLRFVARAVAGKRGWSPALWDTGPRLLGIYSRSLTDTVRAVRAAHGEVREPVTYRYGNATMSETVARGPDGVWWTVPLATDAHRPSPALEADPRRLHSELHTVVLVVDDHDAALRFFVEGGGLRALFDGEMVGDDFERLVGMPPGAQLRLSFLVGPTQAPARLELMSFSGVEQVDRTDDSLGLRRLTFATEDTTATKRSLLAAGAEHLGDVLRGPVGVEIALVEGAGM